MDKVQIIEYFSYVFKKEKENILNKKRIDEQIIENNMVKMQEKDNEMKLLENQMI